MKIIDPAMAKKMERALKLGNGCYNLADIAEALDRGEMQGHVLGDTWAITQVHQWPRRKSVNILFVVGDLEEACHMEKQIVDWAKDVGADCVTAMGRDGWWQHHTPGWKKIGSLYAKDV